MNKVVNYKYDLRYYRPNKNCKPIIYKGTQYASKIQCMTLERITRLELENYLNNA